MAARVRVCTAAGRHGDSDRGPRLRSDHAIDRSQPRIYAADRFRTACAARRGPGLAGDLERYGADSGREFLYRHQARDQFPEGDSVMRRPLIAGNWKMYKTPEETTAFFHELRPLVTAVSHCDVVVCPPSVDL